MSRGNLDVLSAFLLLGIVGCAEPSTSQRPPPSSDAVERACAPQRQKHSFDRGCGAVTMGSAKTFECKRKGGPPGRVHVKVSFAPDGTVPEAVVDLAQPPEARVGIDECIVAKFRELRMPPFDGPPISIGKFIEID